MPSDNDIDFSIEFEMGTKMIFIPSYKIPSTELKELKEQLQDLFDKGSNRPSALGYACLVIEEKR